MDSLKIFSPATVANVSCGFDVLGLALQNAGDEMVFTKTNSGIIRITKIEGADLPFEIENNIVGVVASAMKTDINFKQGVDIEIYKKIKPGSGIGSSAASAAGTAFGVNELLELSLSKKQLIEYAMIGEKFVGGALVADNVAPAILGGISLVKSYEPFEVLNLPVPNDLYVVLAHPQIEIKTSDSRRILKQNVSMKAAITQWANLASLVHALHINDYGLLSRCLEDVIVEPVRSVLMPLFDEVKALTAKNGALGSGISGAGPSIFTLCKGKESAEKNKLALIELYKQNNLDCNVFTSPINKEGIRIL